MDLLQTPRWCILLDFFFPIDYSIFFFSRNHEYLQTSQRQSNIYEPRKELKKLYATSYFGELALINEEPRSASIIVSSETAKCLKMTKSKFDEITFLTKMFNVNRRSELSEEMTEKITLLKSLSVANRTKLLESMSKMTFSPGAYICRQVYLTF
jgi:hypothetical protein